MNKKKLALEVFNSSEMKKIASLKSVDKAALIKMIAEEVSQSSIEEAMTDEQKKVTSNVRNLLTKLSKNPDQWVQAVKDANNETLTIAGFDQLDDELKKFAIEKFFAATRTKEYLAQQTANIAQTKDVPPEEAAKAVLDVAAPEQSTPEAAEELADIADPSGVMVGDATGEEIDIEPAFDRYGQILYPDIINDEEDLAVVLKFLAFTMSKGLIQENFLKLAQGLKYDQKTLEEFMVTLTPEESERLNKVLDNPETLQAVASAISQSSDSEQPSAVEIKPLLDRFAKFIQSTGVLSEQINYVIQALAPKDIKVFGKSLFRSFKTEEIEALKTHFEDTENGALFFKQYFSQDPEFLERFNQALAGEEKPEKEPGEEEEEREQTPEEEVMSIPEEEIQNLSNAYDRWVSGFMTVTTLFEQSEIFGGLWEPIKIFAGKAKSDLEQAERAINPATASREEEEAARLNEAPEDENPAPMDAETPEAEAIPEEEKQEFKRDILETLLVLKRHSDSIADVLEIYKQYQGKLTVGSIEAFRKYGDSNPKSLLYKFVNLLMKDINRLLEIIDTIQPQEKDLAEALLEVEGETFSDKLRMVEAVNEVVVGQTKVLLNLVQKNQSELEPEIVAPEEEDVPSSPEEEATISEQDVNKALSSREKALEIYAEMAKIKKFFPTVQPLDSEYQLKEVIEGFANVIKIIKDHIATMVRFKDDRNINPSSLESARDGLLTIKKVIMDLFGVADEGKIEAPAEDVAAYSEAGRTAMEEEGLKEPTEAEAEWDEEDDEEEEQKEGELTVLDNRTQIERHISTRYLPPQMFKEIFENNEAMMQSADFNLESAYDAFTLFLILTKSEDTDGQPLREAEGDEKSEGGIDMTDILVGARILGLDDKEKIKYIVYKVINTSLRSKALALSMFFKLAEPAELRNLGRRIRIQDSKYPFKVQMDNFTTFVKMYADDEAFEPEELAGEPETAQPDEPAADDTQTPTPVEPDQDSIDALFAELEPVLDSPETQEKIEAAADLPEDEMIDAVQELTQDILSGDEWKTAILDLSLPDVQPDSPEVKQALVDAIEDEIEKDRPGIDLSDVDVDSLPDLEPDMDEPAKIDIGSGLGPKEVRKQALNRNIRSIKNKVARMAPDLPKEQRPIFNVGNAIKVLKKHLEDIGTKLNPPDKEKLDERLIKTWRDLEYNLVQGKAIKADEYSTQITKLVVDALADLGITFLEPESKKDIEEQLVAKLIPVIREVLNRTKNG